MTETARRPIIETILFFVAVTFVAVTITFISYEGVGIKKALLNNKEATVAHVLQLVHALDQKEKDALIAILTNKTRYSIAKEQQMVVNMQRQLASLKKELARYKVKHDRQRAVAHTITAAKQKSAVLGARESVGNIRFVQVNKEGMYLKFERIRLEKGDALLSKKFFGRFTSFNRTLYPDLDPNVSDTAIFLNIILHVKDNRAVLRNVLPHAKGATMPLEVWKKTRPGYVYIPVGHVTSNDVRVAMSNTVATSA